MQDKQNIGVVLIYRLSFRQLISDQNPTTLKKKNNKQVGKQNNKKTIPRGLSK